MIAGFGLMEDEEIEIDLAALALSELDHEGVDLAPYAELLREMTERLAVVGAPAVTAVAQAQALAAVIGGEYGFMGDVASYDAPLNADFIRVLDRRRGLPVSLSILYVAAARRLGWAAHALNIPGHVLVRIGEKAAVVIDPFNGGGEVAPDRLIALLALGAGEGGAGRQEDVAPMANRAILVRLLLNQASRAEQAGDAARAMTVYDRMTVVAPDHVEGWWALARLQLGSGELDGARQSLSAMLEVTRDPQRRELATAALEAIAPR
ncbi:transglutaminase-like domain-containing protein [Sphingobium sufflavum]|uniref:transglutaminase family protein n=1 Tax=Sphingobium sufflavum TaxID=1129547 RepID=UPI001F39E0E5|nr:transglutaminase-like domain-containing protein [Sphingobium sufflavum]MCE7797767.1 transglutaminase-like domain-containing protein [Sphingobium sufflavum]